MDKLKDAITNPAVGAGVPFASAGVAEFCNNLIPILSFISLIIGMLVGLISLYLNVKKILDGKN